MPPVQIKTLVLFVLFLALRSKSESQTLEPDSTASPDVKNALVVYNASLANQLRLYNGKEYKEYQYSFELGQPFFFHSDWSKGTVMYDGGFYKDVSILYNIVTDQLIIQNHHNFSKIQLIKDKVASFSLLGHSFINIPRDSLLSTNLKPGYYDILSTGNITLLARRTKNIQETVRQTVEHKIYGKDHFYVKKNNNYVPIQTKKSFLELFPDKKKEIQQYIRKNKLRFRKDQENVMFKVVAYYNQLTK